ncbi:MAG: class I SAM-dependent methyltransferase [Deltaproteobacteria bacterium]|nr:class I SAM-dependent methyltransferase [Deltaproteobacteria bacterium]
MAEKVCPVWVGYLLASPVRKLFQNPDRILSPYVENGMTVLDIGCAMGFFSLPTAQMVGPNGKVICMDIQEKMIQSLRKRALKNGVSERIETRICTQNSLGLDDMTEKIDFAFAIAVAHEIPDVSGFFSETYNTLKPGHKFLIIEPKGHISAEEFEKTVSIAREIRFTVIDKSKSRFSRVVVLKK